MEVLDFDVFLTSGDFTEVKNAISESPEIINKVRNIDAILRKIVLFNDLDRIKLLLKSGVKERTKGATVSAWLESGDYRRPPHIPTLKILIESGCSFPDLNDQESCLDFISRSMREVYSKDYIEVLDCMIKNGFDPIKTENCAKFQILQCCIHEQSKGSKTSNIFDRLFSLGCSINPISRIKPYAYSKTSLFEESLDRENYSVISKILEAGVEPPKRKNLAIDLAEHLDIPKSLIETLLENKPLNITGKYEWTPIHRAICYENIDYLDFLIDNGADINIKNEDGTPLIFAIKQKKREIILKLAASGASLNLEFDGQTALDIANSTPGLKKICKELSNLGAKSSIDLAGAGDSRAVIKSIHKLIQPGEAWSEASRKYLESLDSSKLSIWHSLVRHCLENNSSKPSKKWLNEARDYVNELGTEDFRDRLLIWFPLIKENRLSDIREVSDEYYDEYWGGTDHLISDNNTRILKGLIWIASIFSDAEISRMLRQLATDMYKKVYGVGMRNGKLGNAAVYSLSLMPGSVGIREIIILRAATKYSPALKNINRVFDKLAEITGKTPDELAEISTPDYGMSDVGKYQQVFGDYIAKLSLISIGKCELSWHSSEKIQKTVPAAIKQRHAEEIKALKALAKDIQTGSSAHSQRLESMYLRFAEVSYQDWKEHYIDHKLVGFIARRLIWRIENEKFSSDVIFSEGNYVTSSGNQVVIPENVTIRLWHPSMSEAQEVLRWRDYLIRSETTQPFKQAHREIYLLTDAERSTQDYSLRFENHILKQSQFHALATQRGWSQNRGGSWDGGDENSAFKSIPTHGISVELEATGAENYGLSDSGIYQCVATGKVIFSKKSQQNLVNIDPLLFSEVMRDIDLFVGVTSIGNDPDWRNRDDNYWQTSSFGDLSEPAKIRKDVIQSIIPKLKISNQLKIEGKFLIVEGNLQTYKIHLGSSNILMEPNDSYLCIVESRSSPNVMLPFEGDKILSLILSKATILANDSKIKDKTILSQINRSIETLEDVE